jgi:hypothetical protein
MASQPPSKRAEPDRAIMLLYFSFKFVAEPDQSTSQKTGAANVFRASHAVGAAVC